MKEQFKAFVHDRLFVFFCIYTSLIAASAVTLSQLNYSEQRYLCQLFYVILVVSLVLWLRIVIKIYKKFFREAGSSAFEKIKNKLTAVFLKIDGKLRQLLHMKPRSAYFGGKDERKTEYNILKRYSHGESGAKAVKIKWKSLEENRQKIRFMFAKAVYDGIASGYKFKYSNTARRLKKDLAKTERQKKLFDLYEDVRYTDHGTEIDDETIEYLLTPEPEEQPAGKKRRK